jgi:hypothetical protein
MEIIRRDEQLNYNSKRNEKNILVLSGDAPLVFS